MRVPLGLIAFGFYYFGSIAHSQKIFPLDCTNCPLACNNDCYGIYVAGNAVTLTWDKPTATKAKAQRRASGCTMSNGLSVCGANGLQQYGAATGNQCDEYPYASTVEDATGASLRCMVAADNKDEGRKLKAFYNRDTASGGCGGTVPCQFQVMVMSNTISNS